MEVQKQPISNGVKIFIAADHAGFALKQVLVPYITALGYDVEDCGAFTLEPTDDYPDIITPCAQRVANEKGSIGIIIGASGQGEAMCANRESGIRAVVYYGPTTTTQVDADGHTLSLLQSARAHNDANILSLGARFLNEAQAKEAVDVFLTTSASEEPRHVRRREKLG